MLKDLSNQCVGILHNLVNLDFDYWFNYYWWYNWCKSIEEFVVYQSIFTDISLYKETYSKGEDFLEDESQEKWEVNIFCSHIEYIYKVDEVKEKNKLVSKHHNVGEIQRKIFEKNRQFTYSFSVHRAVNSLLKKCTFPDIHAWRLNTFKIKFESLKHSASDLFKIVVILIIEILRNWIGKEGSCVGSACECLIEPAYIFHLKGLPDFHGEHYLKSLALVYVFKFEWSAFTKRWIRQCLPLAYFSNIFSIYCKLPSDCPIGFIPWM